MSSAAGATPIAPSAPLAPGSASSLLATSHLPPTPDQSRGMRAVIVGQCTGALAQLTFSNGLLLLFLQSAGFDGASALLLMSIYGIVQPILLLPFAYIGDRDRRRMLMLGALWSMVGFAALATTSLPFWLRLGSHGAMIPAAVGIAVFALGVAFMGAPWYAILSEIVPSHMRGSFLGKLRLSWQMVGLGFGVVCTFLLGLGQQGRMLQIIILCCVAGMAIRMVTFRGIPPLERHPPNDARFRDAVWSVVCIPGYSGFCCYVFLLTLVTASAATLFALIEKDAAGFHDRGVVWMGNLLAMGAVAGFYLAGLLVDRIGTRPVFLLCHFGYAAIFFCVIGRDVILCPPRCGWAPSTSRSA